MAAFKCKMCGGNLEIQEGTTVCECEYCGSKQTLPKTDNEQSLNLINRANHFRQQCEFDKAMEIYERLLNNNDRDAETYWSIVLCRYGIEYVDDPISRKKIATCHRTQYKSILEDPDYLEALAHADVLQKSLYQSEAEYIDNVQKGILEISNKEEPFDVFICYKESDNSGKRTPDSVLAQELYYQLVNEGFKVFFSRITLEDKLGTEYEPYIFAALNSSKVMVVVGTKPEHFNTVWVKNEWSRYLMLMQEDKSRTLIPAYKDMDPYDLPDALSMFQAQDMSKLGFMQDLIRGINKIVNDSSAKIGVKETVVINNSNVNPLIKRIFLFLEDKDWQAADEYCERVLDQDPENASAYLGKLMSELHISKQEELNNCVNPFDDRSNYQKALRFADEKMKNTLKGYIANINERIKYNDYYNAKSLMNSANTAEAYQSIAVQFKELAGYKDSDELFKNCLDKADRIMREEEERRIEAERKANEARLEAERKAEEKRKLVEKRIKRLAIVTAIVCVCAVLAVLTVNVIIPNVVLNNRISMAENNQYDELLSTFSSQNDFNDFLQENNFTENAAKYYISVENYDMAKNIINRNNKQFKAFLWENNLIDTAAKYYISIQQYTTAQNLFYNLSSFSEFLKDNDLTKETAIYFINCGKYSEAKEFFNNDNKLFKAFLKENELIEKVAKDYINTNLFNDAEALFDDFDLFKEFVKKNGLLYATAGYYLDQKSESKVKELFDNDIDSIRKFLMDEHSGESNIFFNDFAKMSGVYKPEKHNTDDCDILIQIYKHTTWEIDAKVADYYLDYPTLFKAMYDFNVGKEFYCEPYIISSDRETITNTQTGDRWNQHRQS